MKMIFMITVMVTTGGCFVPMRHHLSSRLDRQEETTRAIDKQLNSVVQRQALEAAGRKTEKQQTEKKLELLRKRDTELLRLLWEQKEATWDLEWQDTESEKRR